MFFRRLYFCFYNFRSNFLHCKTDRLQHCFIKKPLFLFTSLLNIPTWWQPVAWAWRPDGPVPPRWRSPSWPPGRGSPHTATARSTPCSPPPRAAAASAARNSSQPAHLPMKQRCCYYTVHVTEHKCKRHKTSTLLNKADQNVAVRNVTF